MTRSYRKKPIVIQAFRIGLDPTPKWAVEAGHFHLFERGEETYAEIHTLEGVMRGGLGDYVIRGAIGELYPCRADVFHSTYSPEHSEEESIYKRVLQRIYSLITLENLEGLNKALGLILTWGQLRASPEMSLEEIAYSSNLALERLLSETSSPSAK